MDFRKASGTAEPALIAVLSVTKSRYRSGKRFEIRIRCCWDAEENGGTWTWCTVDVMVEYDWGVETIPELKARVAAVYADLKAMSKAEANLVYALENATLEP